jgi:hypothetical protein
LNNIKLKNKKSNLKFSLILLSLCIQVQSLISSTKALEISDVKNNKTHPVTVPVQERMDKYQEARARVWGWEREKRGEKRKEGREEKGKKRKERSAERREERREQNSPSDCACARTNGQVPRSASTSMADGAERGEERRREGEKEKGEARERKGQKREIEGGR